MLHRWRGPLGPLHAAGVCLLASLALAACEKKPPAATPTAVAATPVATAVLPAAQRNAAMGTGDAPKPEPFTIELRYLEAARQGDRATLTKALERGVAVDTKDDLGRSALFLSVMDAANLDNVRLLESKGAKVDEKDVGGRTPLSYAAALGAVDIARFLVEKGAVIDSVDVQQRTPLYHATGSDQPATATFLLEHGANVNVRDSWGDTPLIVACAKGSNEMAALLLAHKADPSVKDQEGRTARERAAAGTSACLGPKQE